MESSQSLQRSTITETQLNGHGTIPEHSSIPHSVTPEASRYRALTHLAVITGFLLPFAAVPYALSRRRVSRLSKEIQDLSVTVHALRSELKSAAGEVSKRKEEQKRLRTLVHDILQDVDELQFKGKVHSEHLAHLSTSAEQRLEHRNREIGKMKDDIWRLLEESHRKRADTAALAALGTSLADVAAFMHEVELEMGMPPPRGQGDSRGIDRLRKLAAEMAELDKSLPKQEPEASVNSTPSES